MTGRGHAASGIAASVSNWLRRLNRLRLARHRRVRQLAIDRRWFERDDPERPDVAHALQMRLQALARKPRLALIALPSHAGTVIASDWPFGESSSLYPDWEPIGLPPSAADTAQAWATFDHAMAASTADAVVVIPPDCRLTAHALLLFAEALMRFPACRLIYGDDDRIEHDGRRVAGYFRCDWNAELLRSTNYIDGPVCLPRVAWATPSVAHDDSITAGWWSRLLQLTETAHAGQVVHVPHVLAHRLGRQATAPPPASSSEVAAVQAHLARCGLPATASPSALGGVHVRYHRPDPAPLVSMIIPTRNGLSVLRQCIASIVERTRYPTWQIIVVDNGSDDDATLRYLRELVADPRIRVHRDERPFNYSALNNVAAAMCSGEFLALLNNDIEVIGANWLDEMVGIGARADVGAVGARLWYPDERLQHGGVLLGIGGVAGHAHRLASRGDPGYHGRAHLTQEFSAVTGACLLLRRAVFEQLGGLDEAHLAVDFNDIDLCLRIRRAGYRIVWTPHAEFYHHEGATRGQKRPAAQQQRFNREVEYMLRSWSSQLQRDPAYNPNLTLKDSNFAISGEPRVSLLSPWFR